MTGEVSNTELAEYLIGIEAKITCPPYYWPKDKCSWTVMCMEHEEDGRAKDGHRFKVLLVQSHPPYKDKSGHKTWEATLSAWHVKEAIKVNHGGGSKTLDQMFDPQHRGIAGRTLAALARIGRSVAPSLTHGKLVRTESMETRECSEIGLAWAAAMCEQNGQEFAGYASVPRSYYDIKGRPDEDAWYGAADKELTKLFDMGTFEITEASLVPIGTKVMDTVFSFKRKEDSEGRLKELRCRINADGRQQEKGSCGDTFAPTSKFSCVRTICALAAQEGLTLYQFDIKGAFLMSPCKEDIYLNLPGRYRLPKGKVLKLKK
jgi:hypothetical protein